MINHKRIFYNGIVLINNAGIAVTKLISDVYYSMSEEFKDPCKAYTIMNKSVFWYDIENYLVKKKNSLQSKI